MNLLEIARSIGATAENVPPELEVTGVAGVDFAGPTELTFLDEPEVHGRGSHDEGGGRHRLARVLPANGRALLRCQNPHLGYARSSGTVLHAAPLRALCAPPRRSSPSRRRSRSNAHIGAYVVIDDDVEIGANCTLLPHVVIYRGAVIGNNFFAHSHAAVREFCRIGDNVILQNGVVIGADGYGFAPEGESWHKIVQSGTTVIGNNVEVQANSCVDRATVGETRVADGVKIDNLVQVGHGSKIGENTMLCSQVGLAGSTRVGKHVMLAGQVGAAGHCTIGDHAIVTAQSGIHRDVPPNAMVSGTPAIENHLWLRATAVFNKLPELAKAVRKLAKD